MYTRLQNINDSGMFGILNNLSSLIIKLLCVKMCYTTQFTSIILNLRNATFNHCSNQLLFIIILNINLYVINNDILVLQNLFCYEHSVKSLAILFYFCFSFQGIKEMHINVYNVGNVLRKRNKVEIMASKNKEKRKSPSDL